MSRFLILFTSNCLSGLLHNLQIPQYHSEQIVHNWQITQYNYMATYLADLSIPLWTNQPIHCLSHPGKSTPELLSSRGLGEIAANYCLLRLIMLDNFPLCLIMDRTAANSSLIARLINAGQGILRTTPCPALVMTVYIQLRTLNCTALHCSVL